MQTRQRSSLLLSKLNPPFGARDQVDRSAVIGRIEQAVAARLVLVRAPAGFGKTTVMQQSRVAMEQQGVATAWLTADSADNDVNRFLVYLSAAFDRILQQTGTGSAPHLRDETPGELALELIDRVAGIRTPFALFIDDFESVQNSTVLALVREIVDHVPDGSRLVLGSRTLPELGFGRLRATGALLEVEPEDLRFSIDETTRFLREQRGLCLAPEQISKLHDTTEGWAAALWLASMAVERRDQPDAFIDGFSGSSGTIADYLAEDVFANLPERLQAFLLRTSILHQLSPSLCNAVAGVDDAAERLEELERRNLFVLPLDDTRNWYRYHSLFRDFLRAQLDREQPDAVGGLHRAAAHWYQERERPVPAIEHALASGVTEIAVELLLDHAERLLTEGRFRLLTRWLGALPDAVMDAHPRLRVVQVWALAFSRGYKDAMSILARLDGAANVDSTTRAHMLSVRPMLLTMMDQVEDAHGEAMANLEQLAPGVNFPYSMLANSAAYLALIKGEYADARSYLESSRQAQESGTGLFSMIYSEVVEATIDLLQGRLRQATRRYRTAASAQPGEQRFNTNGNVMAGIPLAEVLYESGELDQAERLLNVYVPLIRGVRLPDQMIGAHVVMSRITALRGDPDAAMQLLTELEYLGYEGQLPRVVSSARLERLRLSLVRGDIPGARAEYERAYDRELWRRITPYSLLANDVETLVLGRFRLLLHGRAPARAIAPLRQAVATTERHQRFRRALKLRLLLATAQTMAGERRQAADVLATALSFAGEEGFIRIVADEGPLVTRVVGDFLSEQRVHSLPAAYRDSLMAVCECDLARPAGAGQSASQSQSSRLADPLTPKEIRVLEELAKGHSNCDIAASLFVSESTVRTHLRNINAKLDARNRTEAVAIARELRLIA